MLKKRREAAQKVADRLAAAEQALDVALSLAADLNAAMPAARREAGLSAVVGQDALDRSAAAYAALVTARRELVGAHHSLGETKIAIGLRTLSFGDLEDKLPVDSPRGSDAGHLRSVA